MQLPGLIPLLIVFGLGLLAFRRPGRLTGLFGVQPETAQARTHLLERAGWIVVSLAFLNWLLSNIR